MEDDLAVQALTARTIERVGLRAVIAGNGQEALDWLERNPAPSLILLDLLMPVMDGFEFLRCVRERPEWCRIPVVVLTAKTLTQAEHSVLAEAALQVVTKSSSSQFGLAQVVRGAIVGAQSGGASRLAQG